MELTLDQALQKGIEAHKAGKVQEADQYYTAILKANPKHPDANHNMGVLAVGVGKVEEALSFFKTALEANPSIAQYWLSYIDALIKLDRMEDAKAVFEQAKSKGAKGDGFDEFEKQLGSITSKNSNVQDPSKEEIASLISLYNQNRFQQVFNEAQRLTKRYTKSLDLWNLMGASAAQIGQLNEAALAFQKAIDIKPDYAVAHNNMGNVLKDQGTFEEAIEAYTKAISIKPDYAEAYYNMGVTLQNQGKLGEAVQAYTKAISIKPDHAEAYNNMGNIFQAQGKFEEAIEAYNKSLDIKPDYADAYNSMGNTLQDQGKLEEAMEAYNKALAIKPGYTEAWLNGAEALEKWNKLDDLEIWLEKAISSFEVVPADLRFMKAKLLWRKKKYAETSNLIEDIKFETISEIQRQDYLQLKAKCFEQFKKFDDAFACFTQCNLLVKESEEYLKHNPDQYFKDLKDSLDKLKSSSRVKSKTNSVEHPEFSPTFLVGFPRSGTTLLDTILRSNSKIGVIEEKGMLSAAESFLKKNGHNVSEGELIPSQLNLEAQKTYRREFNKHIDTTSTDKVYIDKLPLNLLQAPLIHQLYPDAKFILALRHPMDTILSCWMQNFKLNAPMANMVDLDRIVDFYCIAMEMFKICRTDYNLNVYEIRYEDLINNFQTVSEAVVQFLNLSWEPAMENYQDTALKRGRIYTPSYSQVVQPIYKDAQYRWLNYQKYLEQYLEQVKPWISEFRYD